MQSPVNKIIAIVDNYLDDINSSMDEIEVEIIKEELVRKSSTQ